MNTKFIFRTLLVALPVVGILIVVGLNLVMAQTPIGQSPDPTPPPPTIIAPRGEIPDLPVGLEEWTQYRGEIYTLSGSGFLMALDNGEVVGVTTAHSVSLDDPDRPLERVALRISGNTDFVVELDRLRGSPGRASTEDLSLDYVLLHIDQPLDPQLVLAPDPRGVPEPGERVSLFSGLGDGHGGLNVLSGTILSASETAAWVLMDEKTFNPSMMSGSPLVSQHTGKVVGMAVASTLRNYRLFPRHYQVLIGMHPIGSILQKAISADEFHRISDYER